MLLQAYSCSPRTVQLPAEWWRRLLRAPARPHRRPPAATPHLFTGMPPRKRGKLDGAASPDPGGDRISALPDDALHHVLSFLPAEDAVRTCLLARRWRHLWKSATGLRILFDHGNEPPSMEKFRQFVIHLLLLRKRDSSLHTCELRLRDSSIHRRRHWLGDDELGLNLWIRHIVDCEVRILRLEIQDLYFIFDLPLVSQHLTTLALVGVALIDNLCNFSNCPNLEHLEFAESTFSGVLEISSKSLKYLSFSNYSYFDMGSHSHTLICTPSLVSLRLDMHFCSLPVLDSMPSLKEAFLRDPIEGCDCDLDCYTCNDDDVLVGYNKCTLLQGLSKAENLTLMSDYNWAYFCRDLECCPTFNNLRTLLLNEWWCAHPDFYGLNCILKHSPVLEKLTLDLFTKGPQHKVEMIGRYNQMERSATISKDLKEIRVKCEVVNKKVYKVLKFLGTFGIHFLFK
ncbi:F-box/FBD/LRR-repeat protein At5g22700-like [Miscanthus floridulus]|uniref:F-box/FBD/LRR-repeat protein At5g22700-like n=1 Tax=Miscanthus floridulus TaxID=154761 RepID=UPI00345956B6